MMMERKFSKFNANDDEFIKHLEAELLTRLTAAESIFKVSDAKVQHLKQEIDTNIKAQDEFEAMFKGKADEIKGSLKDLNAMQVSSSVEANKKLNGFLTFQGEINSETKEAAKKLLDQFDDAITNRVNQVTSAKTPATEFSFLEQEIRNLDKTIEEYQ
jgi:vacuolar-type H+-ATPase subunit I/STV1